MIGKKLSEFSLPAELKVKQYFVKSPVFPFVKFPGVDTILGPEMKSTGEVMGVDDTFGKAYVKAQISAGSCPAEIGSGVHQRQSARQEVHCENCRRTSSSWVSRSWQRAERLRVLRNAGIEAETVYKVNEGRPHIVDYIKSGKVDLIINTPLGRESFFDEKAIRRAAINYRHSLYHDHRRRCCCRKRHPRNPPRKPGVRSLQEYHR